MDFVPQFEQRSSCQFSLSSRSSSALEAVLASQSDRHKHARRRAMIHPSRTAFRSRPVEHRLGRGSTATDDGQRPRSPWLRLQAVDPGGPWAVHGYLGDLVAAILMVVTVDVWSFRSCALVRIFCDAVAEHRSGIGADIENGRPHLREYISMEHWIEQGDCQPRLSSSGLVLPISPARDRRSSSSARVRAARSSGRGRALRRWPWGDPAPCSAPTNPPGRLPVRPGPVQRTAARRPPRSLSGSMSVPCYRVFSWGGQRPIQGGEHGPIPSRSGLQQGRHRSALRRGSPNMAFQFAGRAASCKQQQGGRHITSHLVGSASRTRISMTLPSADRPSLLADSDPVARRRHGRGVFQRGFDQACSRRRSVLELGAPAAPRSS